MNQSKESKLRAKVAIPPSIPPADENVIVPNQPSERYVVVFRAQDWELGNPTF